MLGKGGQIILKGNAKKAVSAVKKVMLRKH
jgi:hypothetical protein